MGEVDLLAEFLKTWQMKLGSDERQTKLETDLNRTLAEFDYGVVKMAFLGVLVFAGASFALVFLSKDAIGTELLKALITAGLGFMAGYGWGKKKSAGT